MGARAQGSSGQGAGGGAASRPGVQPGKPAPRSVADQLHAGASAPLVPVPADGVAQMSGPTRIVSEQRLMAAGWVNSETVSAGRAVKFLSSEYPNGYRHRDQDMVKGEGIPETSTPHLEEVREMLEAKLA